MAVAGSLLRHGCCTHLSVGRGGRRPRRRGRVRCAAAAIGAPTRRRAPAAAARRRRCYRGHVNRIEGRRCGDRPTPNRPYPSPFPQRASKRVKVVREIIREVAGLAPYEKRIGELLKVGRGEGEREREERRARCHARRRPPPPSPLPSLQTGREKRALKFAKRKLGTHSRGKAKRDEVTDILRKKK